MTYNSIEEIICDDSILPKVRVTALNRYEECYLGSIQVTKLAENFGRLTDIEVEKAKMFGMIDANSIISYYSK